jgi:hypothetical protein
MWVFKRQSSRMTPENRERFVQCRTHLSDAITSLIELTDAIRFHQTQTRVDFMCSVLEKVATFCQKINQAFNFDSATRPFISAAPIFTYLMGQIALFNAIMNSHIRLDASLSSNTRAIIWRLTGGESYAAQRPIVKRGSAYFKEISLMQDLTIAEDSHACDCTICFDEIPATDAVVTNCNHSFCGTCIKGFATANKDKTKTPDCPMCRTSLTEFKIGNQQVHNDIQEHILNL